MRFQSAGAFIVLFQTIRMLPAVNLDHKAMLLANEINDVRADRKLAMEFASR